MIPNSNDLKSRVPYSEYLGGNFEKKDVLKLT